MFTGLEFSNSLGVWYVHYIQSTDGSKVEYGKMTVEAWNSYVGGAVKFRSDIP